MEKISADIVIIGAGPAGLCAAVQAAGSGARVIVVDENKRPGGQLFKQIHKFFGSREHSAGVRGYRIGEQLLEKVEKSSAQVMLDSLVYGLMPDKSMGLIHSGKSYLLEAPKIIIAAGAKENYMAFPGSTLPGVMGAGAAQTMVNINRVLPGEKIVMLGSGNVGLIVSYQLLQAGAEVVAVVEGAPKIGGYGVHAAKLRRAGVPIYVSHTIKRAIGADCVTGVEIAQVDSKWKIVPGTEQHLNADTVCLAVGLNPMTELAWMCGCRFVYIPSFGGHVPLHDENMETTVPGVYVAGDITGVEEASCAMEEGNLAGIFAAQALGYYTQEQAQEKKQDVIRRLDELRSGYFGKIRRESKKKQIDAMHRYLSLVAKAGVK
jgi:thioredoxin reductase